MWPQAVLCCSLASVVLTAEFVMPLEDKPDMYKNEPGCYVSQLRIVLPVGHSGSKPGECVRYTCDQDAVLVDTCPKVQASPDCVLETSDAHYPLCCPRCKQLPAHQLYSPTAQLY
ncbi:single domain von willebrand factor type C domain-containing protein [Phthorimaea operculella]|nr:single domain von willebrand factor type C domain-containing protein [Phthorimaea operculella]